MASEAALERAVTRIEACLTALDPSFVPAPAASGAATVVPAQVEEEEEEYPEPVPQPDDPDSVKNYDMLVAAKLDRYCALSDGMDAVVKKQANVVRRVFNVQRAALVVVPQSRKPADKTLQVFFAPMSQGIDLVVALEGQHEGHAFQAHLAWVGNLIPALGWLDWDENPIKYIDDCSATAAEQRAALPTSDVKCTEWIQSLEDLLTALRNFVSAHHPDGLAWGEKVRSMTFWRNALEATGSQLQPRKTRKIPERRNKTVKMPTYGGPQTREPLVERRGKKWCVEFQDGGDITIDKTNTSQLVQIYKCKNCTVQVKGKVNGVSVEGCEKIGVVVDDVIAVFESVNCKRVTMQITGVADTVSIEKTDGAQVYLSPKGLGASIITAKVSELNVMIPDEETGDFKEIPVPEQFKTVWDGSQFTTMPVGHAG